MASGVMAGNLPAGIGAKRKSALDAKLATGTVHRPSLSDNFFAGSGSERTTDNAPLDAMCLSSMLFSFSTGNQLTPA